MLGLFAKPVSAYAATAANQLATAHVQIFKLTTRTADIVATPARQIIPAPLGSVEDVKISSV